MAGLKEEWLRFMNMHKIIGDEFPEYLAYQQRKIYNLLEDVYSVSSTTELQEAIDSIGTGAGTIFIASGTYTISTPIDIDGCGSLVIYGHGDNTILQADDGITIFNITCCQSLLIKTLKLDVNNYTALNPNTQAIIVNETNGNIIGFSDVTIDGDGSNGIGIEIQSNNCYIDQCNITDLKKGVYINNSDNHNITNNIFTGHKEYGIHLDTATRCSINGNTLNSITSYGIYVDTCTYNTFSLNISNSNYSGIFIRDSSSNTISSNICNSNSHDGIHLIGSNYNTISSNTCDGNDSSAVSDTAGIFITNDSDYNTITGNSSNNNNNTGVGDAYGIVINTATCEENVVASNNYNGNDIDIKDVGVGTTITYYVQDSFELQDAIDSIGTKAGVINIDTSFTVATTIDIDGGGSYIIQGEGSNSTLTTGDNQCFIITLARSLLLQNFKIDASAITGRNDVIIEVNETNNDLVIIDNIEIVGIVARGWGIEAVSNYIQIKNCNITTIDMGIKISGDNCKIESNICNGMDEYGIDCTGDYAIIVNNTCNSCNDSGIQMNGGSYCNVSQNQCHSNVNYGIFIFNLDNMVLADNICTLNDAGIKIEDSNYVSVSNNTSSGNTTTGIMITGTSSNNIVLGNTCDNNAAGYGIIIGAATCVDNIIRNNNISGNNWQVWDIGINTDIEYRCSTGQEIQDALDSIAAKSGIIHILPIAGGLQLTATIDVDGGGDYVIEGEGVGSVIDCAGDRSAFSITNIKSCILRNFKIDATDLTTLTTKVIDINEGSNNKISTENINIIGDGTNGYGMECASDFINIRNCDFQGLNRGLNLTSANYCELTGNYFNNIAYGIYLTSSTYNVITSNTFNLGTVAITLSASIYNSIVNNVCSGQTSRAVYLASGSHYCSILGTINYSSYGGIRLSYSNNCTVSNNIIRDPTAGNEGGIYIYYCDNIAINGNILENCNNNAAIRLYHSTGSTITGNSIDGADMNSIQLISGIACTISGNNIQNFFGGTTTGMYGSLASRDGRDNLFIGNTFRDGNAAQVADIGAIGVYNEERTFIVGNQIRDLVNTGAGGAYGIHLFNALCVDNKIGINQISACTDGELLDNGIGTVLHADDTPFGVSWNGDKGTATKNAIYNIVSQFDIFPVGAILMFSGVGWVDNSTIPGWYKCDGNNGTVNLVEKFVRGGATSGATGGSDDAVVVSHSHPAKDYSNVSGAGTTSHSRGGGYAGAQVLAPATGVSGVGKNIPAHHTLIFIMKVS